MADTVSTQVLNDGERNLVVKLTSIGDGTGESAVTKINMINHDCDRVSILELEYEIKGQDVQLLWEGTPNKMIAVLSGDTGANELCWKKVGGLVNDANNSNGNILLTTVGASGAGDFYTITMHLKKKYDA